MNGTDSPQANRRATRSSLAANVGSDIVETSKILDEQPLSVNHLVHHEDPISLDELIGYFPGRRTQILELASLLGPLNSPMFPLFVYGGASTGKTSVVLSIFRHLRRPFVYSSCITCYSPRILFESILNQLLLHRKSESNGYSSAKKCEKPSDFVNLLREALSGIIRALEQNVTKSSSKKLPKKCNGRIIYLIFDNVQLLQGWDSSCRIIPFLFKLHDILRMPEVGLIFISNTSPDAFYSDTGHVEPIPVYFPDYAEDDLHQIFMKNQANAKLYSSFLDVVLRPFCRITRRVNELSAAFAPLFKIYCEPIGDMGAVPNEDMKRKLFSHLQPQIAPSLNETFSIPSHSTCGASIKENKKQKGTATMSRVSESSDVIGFSMSTSARYLLISAFLASRNPATLDASFFDSTGGSDNRKRKRKSSEKSMELKESAEQELLMKGPGTFPLERLLAIYQCITSVEEAFCDEEGQSDHIGGDGSNNILMPDVLLQLSSLCNVNFISKGGSCPLEGSTRYRCNVSEDMALKVARSMKFPLTKYLYRR